MAKDPAINWYFDNWDGGTKLMTRHQKGCYMDLLSAQFHCGHLTIENIKQILGSDFAEWDKCLKAKFEIDENGMFFNGRTEREILKRLNEKNGKSTGGKKAMQRRWGDKYLNKIVSKNLNNIDNKFLETETEIGTGIVNSSFGKSENLFFKIEDCLEIALKDDRWIRSNKTNRQELEKFNKQLEGCGEYEKNPLDYKTHFYHLKRKRPDAIKPEARQLTMEEWRQLAREQDKPKAV